ncbi:MAG: PEGA domain-containing protein [Methanolinea sp.]|nr:PEGA domain-containing protein [Methanolinea sp.]
MDSKRLAILVSALALLAVMPVAGDEPVPTIETPEIPGPVIGGDVGYFAIDSVPQGAEVELDGTFVGETPVMVKVYTTAPPSHTISVRMYGYRTWARSYTGNPGKGETIFVTAELEPVAQTGSIRVSSSPAGAVARLDGGQTLVTPGTFQNVVPGTHTVEIALAGYYPFSTSVNVTAGGTSSVSASLTPVQTTGSLFVSSSPSSAEVYVDEIYRGHTPLTVGSLSTGRHAVRLHLSGYQDYTRGVDISEGSESVVTVSLTPVSRPSTGDIVVTSLPDGAAIYIDGNYRGRTTANNPFDITGVAPGSHRVVLVKAGYRDYAAEVNVAAGSTTTVSAVLSPAPVPPANGEISVGSTPSGAEVYLDNAFKGFSPVILHDVPPGSHAVLLRMKGYSDFQIAVDVAGGQTTSVSGTLSLLPTPTPTKTPLSPVVAAGALAAGLFLARWKRD